MDLIAFGLAVRRESKLCESTVQIIYLIDNMKTLMPVFAFIKVWHRVMAMLHLVKTSNRTVPFFSFLVQWLRFNIISIVKRLNACLYYTLARYLQLLLHMAHMTRIAQILAPNCNYSFYC